jgi:hypothetical protein
MRVLVGAPLPRVIGRREVDAEVQRVLDDGPGGELRAIIGCDRANPLRLAPSRRPIPSKLAGNSAPGAAQLLGDAGGRQPSTDRSGIRYLSRKVIWWYGLGFVLLVGDSEVYTGALPRLLDRARRSP